MNFSDRFQELLSRTSMTISTISDETKIPKSSISKYLSGQLEPKQTNLKKIADFFDVSPVWLMGEDVPMYKIGGIDDIFPYRPHKVPMVGEIACGEPIYASEEHGEFVETDQRADFCLRCKGDSMINAKISNGDTVFLRRQDVVENGEIAAVIIGDEVTLKRVFYYQDENMIILRAENPLYHDLVYRGIDLDKIKIIGKALYCQTKIV